MKSFFSVILVILLTGNTFSASKKVILLKHGYENSVSNVTKNVSFIDALPIDGIVIMAEPVCREVMNKGSSITYPQVYDQNLKLIQGVFKKVTYNWAVVFIADAMGHYAPEWYDNASWNLVINNWRLLARAVRAAGLKGIVLDNEQYSDQGHTYLYDYPSMVDSSSKYSLQEYRDQTRLRGKQIMQACIEEYPNIEVMFYHGPYVSEPKISNSNGRYELLGAFFVGFFEGTIGTQAYLHDGGECAYGFRTITDFQNSYKWRKDTIAMAYNNSPNIPVGLRPYWLQKVKISFANYTGQWPPDASPVMSPTVMRNTLEYGLRTCDDFVWFYGNWNENWLISPGTDLQKWLPAISGARQATNSGISFNCRDYVSVETNGSFSFTFTYNNFTANTPTITYPKKPSWITATAGNATISGTAPAAARSDTVTAIVSAGSFSDTMKLVISVIQYTVIEAETGTLTSAPAFPMQKVSDPNASGGQYITTPVGTGNTIFPNIEATYSLNIPSTGDYYVWLRIYAPSISSTANYGTFVGFNGKFAKPGIANQKAGQYECVFYSTPISLTAGTNQLILGHGNEQVRIDKIIITNSSIPELPAGMNSILPNGKKNLMQQGKNLSIRIMPNGEVQFLGTRNFNAMNLSVHDIFGRQIWTNQKPNGNIWNTCKGNVKAYSGIYFVTLKQNRDAEVGRFALVQ